MNPIKKLWKLNETAHVVGKLETNKEPGTVNI